MPNDLLDLNLGQVQAALEGWADAFLEQHILAVHIGYWCAYYTNGKRPKMPSVIGKNMRRKLPEGSKGGAQPLSEEDLAKIVDMEKRVKEARAKGR